MVTGVFSLLMNWCQLIYISGVLFLQRIIRVVDLPKRDAPLVAASVNAPVTVLVNGSTVLVVIHLPVFGGLYAGFVISLG